jgi:uncharacterized membrane protein (DUF106 family)
MDIMFGWILNIHPALGIMIIAFIISLIITLAIKVFTDQSLMKDLRSEMNELQKQLKELRNNPKKMAKVNDRFMETNMKYMSQSMRPTLFTFIPIIIVFGWLQSHIGYDPLLANEPFELTAEFIEAKDIVTLVLPEGLELVEGNLEREVKYDTVSWLIKGVPGEYEVTLDYMGSKYTKDLIVTNGRIYAPVEKSFRKKFLFFGSDDKNGLNMIRLSNEKIIPFADVPILMNVPFISTWGWFGVYFIFSLIFSLTLRRIFQIH